MTLLYAPPVTERKRIPQRTIDTVVQQIAEKFQPQKIILFGSYALGTPRPERLRQRIEMGDSFLQEIVQQGKVVYESPDA